MCWIPKVIQRAVSSRQSQHKAWKLRSRRANWCSKERCGAITTAIHAASNHQAAVRGMKTPVPFFAGCVLSTSALGCQEGPAQLGAATAHNMPLDWLSPAAAEALLCASIERRPAGTQAPACVFCWLGRPAAAAAPQSAGTGPAPVRAVDGTAGPWTGPITLLPG